MTNAAGRVAKWAGKLQKSSRRAVVDWKCQSHGVLPELPDLWLVFFEGSEFLAEISVIEEVTIVDDLVVGGTPRRVFRVEGEIGNQAS